MILNHPKDSSGFLGQADARFKILGLVFWSILLAFLTKPWAAVAGLSGSLFLFLLSGQNSFSFLKKILLINSFLLFIWLTLPFSFALKGQILFSLGFLEITKEGLSLSILLTIKAFGITLAALAFTGNSKIFELMAGARALGVPEKLTAIFMLMMRYVVVVGQEYERLRLAMKARGFKPDASLHCLASYANLAGMLLIRGLDRAERVHAAMLCRGYTGRFWINTDFRFSKRELILGLLILALSLAVIVLNNA